MLGRLLEKRSYAGLPPWATGLSIPGPLQDSALFVPPTRVSDMAALRVTTVWACVQKIASALAAAPVDVYRKEGEIRRPLPTPQLIADPSGGSLTAFDWWFALLVGLLLTGNAYAVKANLDRTGYPQALPLLDPSKVRPELSSDRSMIESYSIGNQQYPADRILHLRAFTMPGKALGVSPLEQFGMTIGLALQAQQFGYQFFSEGAIPSGIVYSDQKLEEAEAQELKSRIMASWRGSRQPAVLGSGLKYEKVSLNPQEAQFIESNHLTTEEICRIFGMPPEKVGHASSGSSVTYANVEQAGIAYTQDTLLPWAVRMETALSSCLPRPQFVKINLDALVRVDLLTRYTAHGKALRDGWANADERRGLEDLPPLPDKQGQIYLWPLVAKPNQEPDQVSPGQDEGVVLPSAPAPKTDDTPGGAT